MDVHGDLGSASPQSAIAVLEHSNHRRAPRQAPRRYTRAHAACDACRISKTRCDSARPGCAKCARRGVNCVYPEEDPFSILVASTAKILDTVERQERLLQETCLNSRYYLEQHQNQQLHQQFEFPKHSEPSTAFPLSHEVDLESVSRHDAVSTPITGSNTILRWPIFPLDKPVGTFPQTAYTLKSDRFQSAIPNTDPRRMRELGDIFMTKIRIKSPIVDSDQLDMYIAKILEEGIDWSASSCLVLLVFALAAIWGNYPEDDTRTLPCKEPSSSAWGTYISLSVPEDRMKESLGYISMARKRISAAYLDDSLLGVQCLCLFGHWHLINIEPMQGWKMFRTASMLWQTYNLKHAEGKWPRSEQEESLEQRLYWTCLKSECEIRYELDNLPSCDLWLSDFPFSLPSFPFRESYGESDEAARSPSESETAPSYYYLAEISMRRLLNRIRNAVKVLCPEIDAATVRRLSDALSESENQLQQWVECLPQNLQFNRPLECKPPPREDELVKLLRERYVEVRELLCRSYLYLCIHAELDPELLESYGRKASEDLLLAVYRIQTENPFFRHPGSWGACRLRFNHALCLIAAYRAKSRGVASAKFVELPPEWADCVQLVRERLKIWSEEGAGIKELSALLEWLMQN